jgi:hypothetical protein
MNTPLHVVRLLLLGLLADHPPEGVRRGLLQALGTIEDELGIARTYPTRDERRRRSA